MIKATALLQAIVGLAEATPDRRAGCVYFEADGQPCCIVGHGLAALGVPADEFLASHTLNTNTDAQSLARRDLIDVDSESAMMSVLRIQTRQDGGESWADAVAYAKDCDGEAFAA